MQLTAEQHHAMRAKPGMPIDELREAMLTKSVLHDFAPSPWKWRNSPPRETTRNMTIGSLFDCLVTTPEETEKLFAVSPFPDFRTKEAREWRDTQAASGRTVITTAELAQADTMAWVLRYRHADLLDKASFQVPCHADVEAEGMTFPVGGLFDLLPDPEGPFHDCIVDIKTTSSVHPRQWVRTMAQWRYDVQAGLYTMLARENSLPRTRFVFLAIETDPPYESATYVLDPDDVAAGGEWANTQIMRWARCLRDDKWPMASTAFQTVRMPAWVRDENVPAEMAE